MAALAAPDDADVSRYVPTDPEVRKLRAQVAAHDRHGNREQADASRRALDVHRLAEHIRRVVDAAPPLTDAQRARLTVLLAPAPEAVAHGSA